VPVSSRHNLKTGRQRVFVPSYQFLAFAILAAIVYHLARVKSLRTAVLLVTNLLFLASFSTAPVLWIPFAVFLLFGFLTVRFLQARPGSRLAVWVIVTVVLFCWIKRYAVIPSALLLTAPYVTVGLSYIFFRLMSLIIDAGQGVHSERLGVVEYLNYTLNFTCLTAGPIQRYEDYREARFQITPIVLGEAAERIISGLFKVMIVSELLNSWLKEVIAALPASHTLMEHTTAAALLIAIYPVYLYFNFSGYTTFVIGCAALFGMRLPENFDRPFTAVNFLEFWSRWHISLSNWLKSYVYNPLLMSMMRRSPRPSVVPFLAVIAYFATFFLVGAWHGQSSEFLFFGLLQGGGVSANKLYQVLLTERIGRQRYKRLAANPLYAAICRGLTFAWFGLTLFWFWSNWIQLHGFAEQLGAAALFAGFALVTMVASIVLQAALWTRSRLEDVHLADTQVVRSRYVRTVFLTAMAVVLLISGIVLNSPAPQIVYKTF
jgi:D-alanyl-lipoteichoic acid acyltransferase DltB (MBOAT superfamily)